MFVMTQVVVTLAGIALIKASRTLVYADSVICGIDWLGMALLYH